MRNYFYRFAPIIVPIIGLFLSGIYIALGRGKLLSETLLLMSMISSEFVFSFICGMIIRKLYISSSIDPLTGLKNRRFFTEKLVDEFHSQKNHTSLLMIDVDNFKNINDKLGHLMGDKILVDIATILTQTVRSTDAVARWGGEEFVIILPKNNIKEAKAIAERLRKNIRDNDFPINVTISIGIISTKENVEVDNLLKAADDALYKAKKFKDTIVVGTLPSINKAVS